MKKPTKPTNPLTHREICLLLSQRLGGTFVSGQEMKTKLTAILPPDHLSNLVIQFTSLPEFPFHLLMLGKGCPILDKMVAALQVMSKIAQVWMLVLKVTRLGWYVAVEDRGWSLGNHARYGSYIITELHGFLADNAERVREMGG